jgi:hypothetical protein
MRLIVAIIIGVTGDEHPTLCVRTLSKCMSTTMRLEWTELSRPAVCLVSVGEHSIPSLERGCEYPNKIRYTTLSPLVRRRATHSPKEYTSREKAPSSRGPSNNQRLTADQRKRCVNDVLMKANVLRVGTFCRIWFFVPCFRDTKILFFRVFVEQILQRVYCTYTT